MELPPSSKVVKVIETKYKAVQRITFFTVIYFMVKPGGKVGDS